MGHALLWIESLGVALLLVATVAAISARLRGLVSQAGPPALLALLLVALAAVYVSGVEFLHARGGTVSTYAVRYAWSWTIALALGSALVLFLALRRTGPEGAPAGRNWSRSRLAVGLIALMAVDYVTFTNMDLSVKVEM